MSKSNDRNLHIVNDAETNDTESVSVQIEAQREELLGAMAMIATSAATLHWDDHYQLRRVLEDAFKRIDQVVGDLEGIAAACQTVE